MWTFLETFPARWAQVRIIYFRMVCGHVLSKRFLISRKMTANVTAAEEYNRNECPVRLPINCFVGALHTYQYFKFDRCTYLTWFTKAFRRVNVRVQSEQAKCNFPLPWCSLKWLGIFNEFVNCSPHSQQFHNKFFQVSLTSSLIGVVLGGNASFSAVLWSESSSSFSTIWNEFDELSSNSSNSIWGDVGCASSMTLICWSHSVSCCWLGESTYSLTATDCAYKFELIGGSSETFVDGFARSDSYIVIQDWTKSIFTFNRNAISSTECRWMCNDLMALCNLIDTSASSRSVWNIEQTFMV